MTNVRRFSVTNVLVAVNILAYIWLVATNGLATNQSLLDHGALLGLACTAGGEWWRIVTGGFLHASLIHIGSNMLALYMVGNDVELIYGRVRYALLYAVALVGSGLAVVFFAPSDVTVGASGAIFGLLGALVAIGIRFGARGRSLIARVTPWIVLNLVITFAVPNISAAGHIGGLITGFVVGLVLFMLPSNQRAYAYALIGGPPPQQPERDGPARPFSAADEPSVETIEHPPNGAAHEAAGAPPIEVRDPRE